MRRPVDLFWLTMAVGCVIVALAGVLLFLLA
jgi:hypothetical protein